MLLFFKQLLLYYLLIKILLLPNQSRQISILSLFDTVEPTLCSFVSGLLVFSFSFSFRFLCNYIIIIYTFEIHSLPNRILSYYFSFNENKGKKNRKKETPAQPDSEWLGFRISWRALNEERRELRLRNWNSRHGHHGLADEPSVGADPWWNSR